MMISADQIGLVSAALGAILALLAVLEKIWPSWPRVVKPFIKFCAAFSTLIIPNGLIIGFFMYWVATYYWEAGSVELLITNQDVFVTLIGLQALFASFYSLLWSVFISPRIGYWLYFWKPFSKSDPSESDQNAQPLQPSQPDETP